MLTRLLAAAALLASCALAQARPMRIPVVLDTDIGTDIDDAYSLAMILRSPQLRLEAVTTVSGDSAARARIAAKMLAVSGHAEIPVAAGAADKRDAFAQARWAADYHGANLVSTSAVELLKQQIDQEHGRIVIIAIGPLTNIAALLRRYPAERKQIREIALMGGSVARGYTPGSSPAPEYNIAADAEAAQQIFRSGIPLLVAPLDVTASLQLSRHEREQLDALHTPLTGAVHELYALWNAEHNPWAPRDTSGEAIPTLHDTMAVALIIRPGLCQTKRMDLEITPSGMTKPGPDAPNATVALHSEPAKFLAFYSGLFTH